MFEKLVSLLPTQKARDTALTAGGMAALLAGRKLVALGMFTRGIYGLEQSWRETHPDFNGSWSERWTRAVNFYESTHINETNRKLHRIGIPMILGGTVGLLMFKPFRPTWFVAASSFTAGWALNLVGHYGYEQNAPAFGDDPLSFLAGPMWDARESFSLFRKRAPGDEPKDVTATVTSGAQHDAQRDEGRDDEHDGANIINGVHAPGDPAVV